MSYVKLDNDFQIGSQIKHLNGRIYNVLEVYGNNDVLLQDTQKKEYVFAHGLQKYDRTENGEAQRGYEWSSGEYYSSLSSINFQQLEELYNDVSLDGWGVRDISLSVLYDPYNNRVSIEDEENHLYKEYNAYTPSDISSALNTFMYVNYNEEKNLIRDVVKECSESMKYIGKLKPLIPYQVIWGNGTYQCETMEVLLENSTTDYGAILDIVVDRLEEQGRTDCFIGDEETEEAGGDIFDDEYVTAGNHGLNLYHHGDLRIEEQPPKEVLYTVSYEDAKEPWKGVQTLSFDVYDEVMDYLKGEVACESTNAMVQIKGTDLPIKVETNDGRVLFEGDYRVNDYGHVVDKSVLDKATKEKAQEKKSKGQDAGKETDKSKKRDNESR